jgi:membrane-associated phospholipid phosphatase
MRRVMLLVMMVTCVAAAIPVHAQQAPPQPPRSVFSTQDAVFLGVLVGGTGLLVLVDRPIAEKFQDEPFRSGTRDLATVADNFRASSTKALAVAGVSAYAVGRVTGVRSLASVGVHGLEAGALAQALGYVMKGGVGRARPRVDITDPTNFDPGAGFDSTAYGSFPSGFALLGFTAASVLTAESATWHPHAQKVVGPLTYGAATLVGFNRLYDNKHWMSDVFFAAGLGVFIGRKVVSLNRDHPTNFIDRVLLPRAALGEDGGVRLGWLVPLD